MSALPVEPDDAQRRVSSALMFAVIALRNSPCRPDAWQEYELCLSDALLATLCRTCRAGVGQPCTGKPWLVYGTVRAHQARVDDAGEIAEYFTGHAWSAPA